MPEGVKVVPEWKELKRSDYQIVVVPINDDGDPDEFYWHLYYQGQKINGGVIDSVENGYQRAGSARIDHNRMEWLAHYFWDVETCRWIPKKELYH
jgi:hypothetical protein